MAARATTTSHYYYHRHHHLSTIIIIILPSSLSSSSLSQYPLNRPILSLIYPIHPLPRHRLSQPQTRHPPPSIAPHSLSLSLPSSPDLLLLPDSTFPTGSITPDLGSVVANRHRATTVLHCIQRSILVPPCTRVSPSVLSQLHSIRQPSVGSESRCNLPFPNSTHPHTPHTLDDAPTSQNSYRTDRTRLSDLNRDLIIQSWA